MKQMMHASAMVNEFASLQRLALAGETGECSATQACGEIANRLPDLLGRALATKPAEPDLLEALREIADGCMNLRPGHVDAAKNRTKAEIESIARAAIAKATGERA